MPPFCLNLVDREMGVRYLDYNVGLEIDVSVMYKSIGGDSGSYM